MSKPGMDSYTHMYYYRVIKFEPTQLCLWHNMENISQHKISQKYIYMTMNTLVTDNENVITAKTLLMMLFSLVCFTFECK